MAFPRKFRLLLEISASDVQTPDYVWLTYAVCAVTSEACGWGGWMIEVAFKGDGVRHATGTGDRVLEAVDEQVCPRCGRQTFLTGASVRLEPSENQEPTLREGVDYDVVPMEYED